MHRADSPVLQANSLIRRKKQLNQGLIRPWLGRTCSCTRQIALENNPENHPITLRAIVLFY